MSYIEDAIAAANRAVVTAGQAREAADDAIRELRIHTRCVCDPAFSERGRVDPQCCHEFREEVDTLLAAAGPGREALEALTEKWENDREMPTLDYAAMELRALLDGEGSEQ